MISIGIGNQCCAPGNEGGIRAPLRSRTRDVPVPTDIAELSRTAGSRVLRLIAADPSAAIVGALSDGPLRSGRLREALPAHSPRTVYRRLEELERLGVLERQRLNASPPAIAYELTAPAGRDM